MELLKDEALVSGDLDSCTRTHWVSVLLCQVSALSAGGFVFFLSWFLPFNLLSPVCRILAFSFRPPLLLCLSRSLSFSGKRASACISCLLKARCFFLVFFSFPMSSLFSCRFFPSYKLWVAERRRRGGAYMARAKYVVDCRCSSGKILRGERKG